MITSLFDSQGREESKPPSYQRYHIETKPARDITPQPNRFRVRVKKHRLALLLLKELVRYRANKSIILSRPCMYGVFGGPVGGFAPREHLCVGCLRCTTEYPDVVQIYHNSERERLGDTYFSLDFFDAVHYEAQTGRVPVKGAGYRGKFGGEGWEGMWTDMSEIVRPTRDGIHGREFISTVADIGEKSPFLTFDERGFPREPHPRVLSLPLPILFDIPPASLASKTLLGITSAAARDVETLAIVPLSAIIKYDLGGEHLVPLVTPNERGALSNLAFVPRLIEMAGWEASLNDEIRARFPQCIVSLRVGDPKDIGEPLGLGIRVFHLAANYHGRAHDGCFLLDSIRAAHRTLVEAGCRDEVTLIAGGGIVAAEHVPKAIISGADAVALDTALFAALQAVFLGDCADPETSQFQLPPGITVEWGVQRLKNLLGSWRDQMLEVLGAMGLREVRRLRGEVGRAMFVQELEREAFGGIAGYGNRP